METDDGHGTIPGPFWARAAVPNSMTVARLVLGMVFPLLPDVWRLVAFLVATATEALDGPLARLLRATTAFGRLLDPIADKVFVLAVVVTLTLDGMLEPWMIPLIAARDLLVVAGGIWVGLRHGFAGLRRMSPTPLGKLVTVAQYLLLLGLLVQPVLEFTMPLMPALAVTAALSLAAGVHYLLRYERP